MSKALVILHAAPTATDSRALTAVRLSGALLADSKDVTMFLVEDGALLADPKLSSLPRVVLRTDEHGHAGLRMRRYPAQVGLGRKLFIARRHQRLDENIEWLDDIGK
jgi:hypothetical protein